MKLKTAINRRTNNVRRIQKALPEDLDSIADTATEIGLDLMNQLCPEDTGDLKSTNRRERIRQGHWVLESGHKEGASGAYVDYEGFVNDGTDYQAANPYYSEAVAYAKKQVVAEARRRGFRVSKKL